jgi:hypothetical protein
MREDMVAQTEKEVAAASGAYNACVAMQDQAEAELALFSAKEIKKQTKLSAFFASAMSCVSLPPLANPLAATRGRAGPVAAGSRTPEEQQQHARRAEKNAALLKLRRAREAAGRALQALMHCRARLHRITPAGSAVLQNSGDSPAVSQTGEASSSLGPQKAELLARQLVVRQPGGADAQAAQTVVRQSCGKRRRGQPRRSGKRCSDQQTASGERGRGQPRGIVGGTSRHSAA